MFNQKGFFFVAKNGLNLKQLKIVSSNYGLTVVISYVKMTYPGAPSSVISYDKMKHPGAPSSTDLIENVATAVFTTYKDAAEYQKENKLEGEIYHLLPEFTFMLGKALIVEGVSDTGHLIGVDKSMQMRDTYIKEHLNMNAEAA